MKETENKEFSIFVSIMNKDKKMCLEISRFLFRREGTEKMGNFEVKLGEF